MRILALALALFLLAFGTTPPPAEAGILGDLLKKLQKEDIEKTAPDGAADPAAAGTVAAPPAAPAAMGEIEALLKQKKYREALAAIEGTLNAGEAADTQPFLAYLRGQIAAYYLKDREAALKFDLDTASRFKESRYGRLAREHAEALSANQLTEVDLKKQMDTLKTEVDALTKELDGTSLLRFIRRAELKKQIAELQGRYVAKKELLESFRESPESLVQRADEGRRTAPTATRATDSRTARCIKDSYNLRDKPWGKVVGELKRGDVVTIIGEEKVKGNTWYKIQRGDKVAYVCELGVAVQGAEDGVEEKQDEFQSGIVRRLSAILYGGGAEDPTDLSDEAYFNLFVGSPELSRAFPELIEKRDAKEMRAVVIGLMRMLHFTPLRKALGKPLAKKNYAEAYRTYKEKYTDSYADPAIYPFDEAAPLTIVINIAAKRFRIYRDGLVIFDVPMVPGQKQYPGVTGNTKTRVGSYKLENWYECYTTADYPVKWSDNCWKGAFGKWAAKIGPNGGGQHIHGTTGPEILGNIPINYAPGSHGCIRLANKNITRVHEMAKPGTKVIKTYCLHERIGSRGVFGDTYKTAVYDNLYDYQVTKDGWNYPGAGVLLDHSEPADAIR